MRSKSIRIRVSPVVSSLSIITLEAWASLWLKIATSSSLKWPRTRFSSQKMLFLFGIYNFSIVNRWFIRSKSFYRFLVFRVGPTHLSQKVFHFVAFTTSLLFDRIKVMNDLSRVCSTWSCAFCEFVSRISF